MPICFNSTSPNLPTINAPTTTSIPTTAASTFWSRRRHRRGNLPRHRPRASRVRCSRRPSPQGLRNQFLCTCSAHQDPPAADQKEPRRPNRQSLQHSRIPDASGRPQVAYLQRQIFRLRCVEDGAERIHGSPRL